MMLKKLGRSKGVQRAAGSLMANYLRLVNSTSRYTFDPENIYEIVDSEWPCIIAMWHGQHFMVPFARKPYHKARVLISRHRDGEINAIAASKLGIGLVRGSGDLRGRFHEKGGASAFRAMLQALDDGESMVLTADVPKIARRAGKGIVKLAGMSGRPIIPVAVATSRRYELDNWDKSALNLPFSKAAIVAGDWVRVPAEPDDKTLEAGRQAVEDGLNGVTARAYEIVDS